MALDVVIPNGSYTHVAAAKTLTLVAPYNTLTKEQIISIKNLTKNKVVYDCKDTTTSITMVGAVITYTYAYDTFANGDIFQIFVNVASSSTGGEVTIDDTTPVDVNLTNSSIAIDDSTPIDTNIKTIDPLAIQNVLITNIPASPVPVAVDTSAVHLNVDVGNATAIDVNFTNTSIAIDDSTPVNVNVSNGTDIGVSVNNATDIDVNVTNASIAIDDTTPVDVNITNASVTINDTSPIDVNLTNSSIVIDDSTPVDVNIVNPAITNISVYSANELAISTTLLSSAQAMTHSNGQPFRDAYIYVSSSGTSTSFTVTIEAAPAASITLKAPIQTLTFNATATKVCIPLSVVPAYLYFTGDNLDAVAGHTAIYSIMISGK